MTFAHNSWCVIVLIATLPCADLISALSVKENGVETLPLLFLGTQDIYGSWGLLYPVANPVQNLSGMQSIYCMCVTSWKIVAWESHIIFHAYHLLPWLRNSIIAHYTFYATNVFGMLGHCSHRCDWWLALQICVLRAFFLRLNLMGSLALFWVCMLCSNIRSLCRT